SLAMTLLDCGLLPGQFLIEGIDVSRRALKRAETAFYTERAIRETEAWTLELCRRHLRREKDGYRIDGPLRSLVEFRHGNLATSQLLAGRRAAVDVIFCRNVLIYFTSEARQTALDNLAGLLAEEGMLYIGHTESRTALDPRFRALSSEFPFGLGLA